MRIIVIIHVGIIVCATSVVTNTNIADASSSASLSSSSKGGGGTKIFKSLRTLSKQQQRAKSREETTNNASVTSNTTSSSSSSSNSSSISNSGSSTTRQLRSSSSFSSSSSSFWKKESFPNLAKMFDNANSKVDDDGDNNNNSNNNNNMCRSYEGRICDPDLILNSSMIQQLENKIISFEKKQHIIQYDKNPCVITAGKNNADDNENLKKIKIIHPQIAVAIVRNIDLTSYGEYDDEIDIASESFATYIHNKWGVGSTYSTITTSSDNHDKCENDKNTNNDNDSSGSSSTGILIFLSINDRSIYISKGSALNTILTDKRIDNIINSVKDLLRNKQYDDAIDLIIDDIDTYINIIGKPNIYESLVSYVEDYCTIIILIIFFIIKILSSRYQSNQQRIYTNVTSQLNQIDRIHAEVLQGKYQCKSCPICLEPFINNINNIQEEDKEQEQKEEEQQEENIIKQENNLSSSSTDNNTTTGGCTNIHVRLPSLESGKDNDINCNENDDDNNDKLSTIMLDSSELVDNENVVLDEEEEECNENDNNKSSSCTSPLLLDNDSKQSTITNSKNKLVGSDGKPLKLLRCGHVFDETCWKEWVANGRTSTIHKCPICQQDVGSGSSSCSSSNSGSTGTDGTTTSSTSTTTSTGNNILRHRSNSYDRRQQQQRQEDENDQEDYSNNNNNNNNIHRNSLSLRQYNRERNFRLACRYPRYIQQQQIQRWTSSNYRGTMSNDSTFVRNNPATQHSSSSSSSSFGSSSFGGGSSSGGRGGRW